MDEMKASFDQVPLVEVIERIEEGNLCVNELWGMFRWRLELEEKSLLCASKISRSNVYEHEIQGSTSEKALGFFKNYYLFLSQENAKYHKNLLENVVSKLDEVRSIRSTETSKYKAAVQNTLKEMAIAIEALNKAKQNYAKAKLDVQTTESKLAASEQAVIDAEKHEVKKKEKEKEQGPSKLSMGRFLSAFEATPEQRREERDKMQKKLIKRFTHLNDCIGEIAAKKKALAKKHDEKDRTIQIATLAFEAAEKDRLQQIRNCLVSFCHHEKQALEKQLQLLVTFEKSVSDIDVMADISTFIEKQKKVELTHKYAKAVSLMDWDYQRRRYLMSESTGTTSSDTTAAEPPDAHPDASPTIAAPVSVQMPTPTPTPAPVPTAPQAQVPERALSERLFSREGVAPSPIPERGLSERLFSRMAPAKVAAPLPLFRTSSPSLSNPQKPRLSLNSAPADDEVLVSTAVSASASAGAGAGTRGQAGGSVPLSWDDIDDVDTDDDIVPPRRDRAIVPMKISFTAGGGIGTIRSHSPSLDEELPEDEDALHRLLGSRRETFNGPFTSNQRPSLEELLKSDGLEELDLFLDDEAAQALAMETEALASLGLAKQAQVPTQGQGQGQGQGQDQAQGQVRAEAGTGGGGGAGTGLVQSHHDAVDHMWGALEEAFGWKKTQKKDASKERARLDSHASDSGGGGGEVLAPQSSNGDRGASHPIAKPAADSDDKVYRSFGTPEWSDALGHKAARDLFLQELDDRRGTHGQLAPTAFSNMCNAMQVFLDHCHIREDVKCAMRIANMANTFHMRCDRSDVGEGVGEGDEAEERDRRYVQEEEAIRGHPVWLAEGFWDAALLEGVGAQLDLSPPVLWDELPPEGLREAVIGVHNVVFGQLGALAFTMSQVGLRRSEVLKRATAMGVGMQLSEEQQHDLQRSILLTQPDDDDKASTPGRRPSLIPAPARGIVGLASALRSAPTDNNDSAPPPTPSPGPSAPVDSET